MAQQVLVISGVSMKEGGIRTVLTDALTALDRYASQTNLKVYALVPSASDYHYPHIECIGFPNAKKNWWNRMYLEYFGFKKLSLELKADYWLSLHDTTPNVVCKNQFMYAHNPTVFYHPRLTDWMFNYKIGIFSFFYHWVYRWNISKNTAVFAQQQQLCDYLKKLGVAQVLCCPLNQVSIPVAIPQLPKPPLKTLFYPLVPRSFKNVEVIAEALQLLTPEENNQLEIHLSFDPKDSNYASYIAKKYPLNNLKFLGKLSREMVFAQYQISDGLLFPSKLETWGLPISEAKAMQKPIWAADLPYAKETVGDYQEVVFFDPENPIALAELFRKWLNNSPIYSGNKAPERSFPVLDNWNAIFDYIRSTDAKI